MRRATRPAADRLTLRIRVRMTPKARRMTSTPPLMILVAGPYRSGTGDDPEKIGANVRAMTQTALQLYRMGHMPMLGEWVALPLLEAAGSRATGDAVFNEIFHPSAVRLIGHCDA